jgi:hypothetical protein
MRGHHASSMPAHLRGLRARNGKMFNAIYHLQFTFLRHFSVNVTLTVMMMGTVMPLSVVGE